MAEDDDDKIDAMRRKTVETRRQVLVGLRELGWSDEELVEMGKHVDDWIRRL